MTPKFRWEDAGKLGHDALGLAVEQSEWSQKTFGTDEQRGPIGPLKHLAIEVVCELLGASREKFAEFLLHVETHDNAAQFDIKEFADLQILLMDAARRAGYGFYDVIRAGRDKMEENMKREWPAFDPAKVNEAVEHIRKDGE